MERLIVVAIGNKEKNTITFKVVKNSRAAFDVVAQAHNEKLICAVGAIDYEHSKEKAYKQLCISLRKKILEKIKVKI